jgi:hypothetical protein
LQKVTASPIVNYDECEATCITPHSGQGERLDSPALEYPHEAHRPSHRRHAIRTQLGSFSNTHQGTAHARLLGMKCLQIGRSGKGTSYAAALG